MAKKQSLKKTDSGQLLDSVTRQLYIRNAELATRNKTLSLLRRLDTVAIESLEPDVLSEKICRILIREFHFRLAGVLLRTDGHLYWSSLLCEGRRGLECPLDIIGLEPISVRSASHPGALALQKSRKQTSHKVSDLFPGVSLDVMERVQEYTDTHNMRTIFAYPLSTDTEQVGSLVIGVNDGQANLSHYERETIRRLIPMIVVALQKARQYVSLQQTTKKLRVANKKLKELDGLKTEFLSIASHELRTPLAVIKGYILTLQGGMLGRVSKEQSEAIQTIAGSAERLIFLVNHLLDVTRIESGRLTVNVSPVDATALLRDVWQFVTPLAKEKKLQLRAHIPKEELMVMADADRLREVFVNVFDNAIKYTPEGTVDVSCQRDGAYMTVRVRDTGFGLSPRDKERLFQKFSQGSASKHVKTTTGLGLYVVKKLLEAMGGSIRAESAGIGKGSTFTIRLACAPKG